MKQNVGGIDRVLRIAVGLLLIILAATGTIGAVVGATCTDAGPVVAALPHSFILSPGIGAQGATIDDCRVRMATARGRILPNVSRELIAGGTTADAIGATIRRLNQDARALLA